jgi:methylamine dehydrogenase heavy chain
MNPQGGEGSHKDGGAEVWAYDLAARQRTDRIVLKNWGVAIGTSGKGDGRLLYVTNAQMAIDVYTLADGEYLKTLNIGAATPFMHHGAY